LKLRFDEGGICVLQVISSGRFLVILRVGEPTPVAATLHADCGAIRAGWAATLIDTGQVGTDVPRLREVSSMIPPIPKEDDAHAHTILRCETYEMIEIRGVALWAYILPR
jgi:hypothetical protein